MFTSHLTFSNIKNRTRKEKRPSCLHLIYVLIYRLKNIYNIEYKHDKKKYTATIYEIQQGVIFKVNIR